MLLHKFYNAFAQAIAFLHLVKIEILPAFIPACSPPLCAPQLFLNDLAQPLMLRFLPHRIQHSIFAHLITLVSRSCICLIIINTLGHFCLAILRGQTPSGCFRGESTFASPMAHSLWMQSKIQLPDAEFHWYVQRCTTGIMSILIGF